MDLESWSPEDSMVPMNFQLVRMPANKDPTCNAIKRRMHCRAVFPTLTCSFAGEKIRRRTHSDKRMNVNSYYSHVEMKRSSRWKRYQRSFCSRHLGLWWVKVIFHLWYFITKYKSELIITTIVLETLPEPRCAWVDWKRFVDGGWTDGWNLRNEVLSLER